MALSSGGIRDWWDMVAQSLMVLNFPELVGKINYPSIRWAQVVSTGERVFYRPRFGRVCDRKFLGCDWNNFGSGNLSIHLKKFRVFRALFITRARFGWLSITCQQ